MCLVAQCIVYSALECSRYDFVITSAHVTLGHDVKNVCLFFMHTAQWFVPLSMLIIHSVSHILHSGICDVMLSCKVTG